MDVGLLVCVDSQNTVELRDPGRRGAEVELCATTPGCVCVLISCSEKF